MRKPSIMLAIGFPSPMARESDERDEDSLDREEHFGDDGRATTLQLIFERLQRGDESAAHSAMAIARCLQEMAHQAAAGNKRGLKHWYEKCNDLVDHVNGESEDEEAPNGE
jgi:hypothetical protein